MAALTKNRLNDQSKTKVHREMNAKKVQEESGSQREAHAVCGAGARG